MTKRADIRQITRNIEESLSTYNEEQLRNMLGHVFREYVVEGQPKYLVHQTETIEDLNGLSFAELIATLQSRLDLEELGQLKVEGGQVFARVGGTWLAVDSAQLPTSAAEPVPPVAAQPPVAPAATPPPQASTPAAPKAAATPPPSSAPPEKKEAPKEAPKAIGDDDASKRFSLLELD